MPWADIHKTILDCMSEAVYVLNRDMEIIYANPATERLTGYTYEESVGKKCDNIFCERSLRCDELCPLKQTMNELHPILHRDAETRTREGDIKQTQISVSPFYEDAECVGSVVVIKDITSLKLAEEQKERLISELQEALALKNMAEESLRRSEKQLRDIIDFLPDMTFAIDPQGKITTWNRAAEEYTGVRAEDILGKGDQEYSIPFFGMRRPMLVDMVFRPVGEAERLYHHTKREGRVIVGEGYINGAKHGKAFVSARAVPLVDSNDNIIGAIESLRDITARKREEEKLRERSEKDHLTMIFNRRKLFEILEIEVEKAVRYSRPLSVILIDLDHFKKVNDLHGHHIGDLVLKATTRIIENVKRRVDIFARYGGEEFIVVCPETDIEGSLSLAEKMRSSVEHHFHPVAGRVTISAGVAELSAGDTFELIIKRADEALYAAKKAGRNRVEGRPRNT